MTKSKSPVLILLSNDLQEAIKILPRTSVNYGYRFVCLCVRVSVLVVNGSLDLTARAARLQAFLFHLAIQGAATEFRCAGQMNRARGARVLEHQKVAEHCNFSCQQPCQRRSLSIVSECWHVWRVPSTKAFSLSAIVAGFWRGA